MAKRIGELDGLRAIAVSVVVIFHAYGERGIAGGYLGVDMFFVISGYIITTILLKEQAETGAISLKQFYLRRIRRIWPALAVLLGMVISIEAARATVTGGHPGGDTLFLALVSAASMMNWVRAFRYSGGGILGHIWSLSVEEQFYLLWPLLLSFCLRFQNRRAILQLLGLGILAVLAWRIFLVFSSVPPERTYNGLDTRADALLIGCLLAFYGTRTLSASIRMAGLAIASCILLTMLMLAPWTSIGMNGVGFTVAALCAAFWVAETVEPHRMTARILGSRSMSWLGLRSYSLYLWHYPVIVWMTMTSLPSPVAMPLAIGLSLALADASYRFVELPFLTRRPVNFANNEKLSHSKKA